MAKQTKVKTRDRFSLECQETEKSEGVSFLWQFSFSFYAPRGWDWIVEVCKRALEGLVTRDIQLKRIWDEVREVSFFPFFPSQIEDGLGIRAT